MLFWLKWFDRIIPEKFNSDSASSVYFIGEKQETPISGKDIIDFYKGAQ